MSEDDTSHRVYWHPPSSNPTELVVPGNKPFDKLCNAIRERLHPGVLIDQAAHASVDIAIRRNSQSRPGGLPGSSIDGGPTHGEKTKAKGQGR